MEKNIREFLLRAKKATYAGKGMESKPSRPNSHDLEYKEGELLYIDTYIGGTHFAGEEALWQEGVPFWSMNYVGRVIHEDFEGDFLKEALSHVPIEEPFRGPREYANGEHVYTCTIEGDTQWFTGYEAIHVKNCKVYECYFHGGKIV